MDNARVCWCLALLQGLHVSNRISQHMLLPETPSAVHQSSESGFSRVLLKCKSCMHETLTRHCHSCCLSDLLIRGSGGNSACLCRQMLVGWFVTICRCNNAVANVLAVVSASCNLSPLKHCTAEMLSVSIFACACLCCGRHHIANDFEKHCLNAGSWGLG